MGICDTPSGPLDLCAQSQAQNFEMLNITSHSAGVNRMACVAARILKDLQRHPAAGPLRLRATALASSHMLQKGIPEWPCLGTRYLSYLPHQSLRSAFGFQQGGQQGPRHVCSVSLE